MAATTSRNLLITVFAAGLALVSGPAEARTIRVGPGEIHTTVAAGINAAETGDTVRVVPGVYSEHGLIVRTRICLFGTNYPVLDAQNGGDILTVVAAGTVVRGFLLQNVGTSFIEDRSALRIKSADDVRIEDCRFEHTIFAIYVEHSTGVVVTGNRMTGDARSEVSSGNGIHLWYCKHARIEGNEIHGHRDGIYFEFVEDSMIRGNLSSHNVRYGLHFMFSHRNEYVANRFESNGAGVAVMYSEHVVMRGNVFAHNWGASSYGLLLKEIRDSEISDNRFIGNTVGLHVEGSDRLRVTHNEFTANGYAARIMANSMDGTFTANNFIGNAFDVVTNSRQNFNIFEANYWSEYRGYDLDRNGVGDVPHHPVRLFSLLVEKSPPGVVLLGSLFVSLIDTAERVMPVFTPEALVDHRPSMTALVIANQLPGGLRPAGGSTR